LKRFKTRGQYSENKETEGLKSKSDYSKIRISSELMFDLLEAGAARNQIEFCR